MIRSLDHLVLTVRDVDRAVDFYCRGLGMRKEMFGNGRVAIHFGEQKFNLHEADGAPLLPRARNPVAGGADFCLVAEVPLDEVIRRLGNAGIAIERGPVDQTGARGPMRSVYMRDPDDNLVEICVYPPGS
jgi:catechol 2,3-dioxygenase-like lactoylglutathione lyase family enzyme